MTEQTETTAIEDLKAMVAQMMKQKNIHQYEIQLEGNSNAGDGYMGVMLFFKISSNEQGISYNLIFKSAGKGDTLRQLTFMDKNFEREIFIYSAVFPKLKAYFGVKNPSILEYVPKLYSFCKELRKESLVLENLKADNYVMWKKKEPLDFEHTKMVLRRLAEWHGTVMAYRDQNPNHFQEWEPQLTDIRYDLLVKLGLVNHARVYYKKVLDLLEAKGKFDLVEKYKAIEDKLDQFFLPAADQDRLVITHADLWVNNVLFKYDDNSSVPKNCKIIDFQVAQVNTPVEDLCFFIYGSCDSVLEKFDILLEDYYSTLSTTVRKLGSNIDKIFTYNQLQDHWKKYGMNGVISSLEIIKLQCLTEDEIPDTSDLVKNGETDMSKPLHIVMKNQDLYFRRLLNVFEHFGEHYL